MPMQLFCYHLSGLLRLRIRPPTASRRGDPPRIIASKFIRACTLAGCLLGIGLAVMPASCQPQISSPLPAANPQEVELSPYSVVERGPHHRVWQRVTARTNEQGRVLYHTNAFTELATGMSVQTNGQWIDASS